MTPQEAYAVLHPNGEGINYTYGIKPISFAGFDGTVGGAPTMDISRARPEVQATAVLQQANRGLGQTGGSIFDYGDKFKLRLGPVGSGRSGGAGLQSNQPLSLSQQVGSDIDSSLGASNWSNPYGNQSQGTNNLLTRASAFQGNQVAANQPYFGADTAAVMSSPSAKAVTNPYADLGQELLKTYGSISNVNSALTKDQRTSFMTPEQQREVQKSLFTPAQFSWKTGPQTQFDPETGKAIPDSSGISLSDFFANAPQRDFSVAQKWLKKYGSLENLTNAPEFQVMKIGHKNALFKMLSGKTYGESNQDTLANGFDASQKQNAYELDRAQKDAIDGKWRIGDRGQIQFYGNLPVDPKAPQGIGDTQKVGWYDGGNDERTTRLTSVLLKNKEKFKSVLGAPNGVFGSPSANNQPNPADQAVISARDNRTTMQKLRQASPFVPSTITDLQRQSLANQFQSDIGDTFMGGVRNIDNAFRFGANAIGNVLNLNQKDLPYNSQIPVSSTIDPYNGLPIGVYEALHGKAPSPHIRGNYNPF